MTFTIWPSPAKINLFLYVIKKYKKSGYHQLQTLIQFLSYSDDIYIEINNTGNIEILPFNNISLKNNLIFQAINLLIKKSNNFRLITKNLGVKIIVNKKIPYGSGLGGGSSNAATILLVLNKLWKLNFSIKELSSMALLLGTDVPFFIHGRSAFVEGIGEKLKFIHPPQLWYLIAYPKIEISTKFIFQNINLKYKRKKKLYPQIFFNEFKNDFEKIAKKKFYKLNKSLNYLSKYSKFRLTGTGSCIFAEFASSKDAYNVFKKFPLWIKGFVTQGTNYSPLHNILNY